MNSWMIAGAVLVTAGVLLAGMAQYIISVKKRKYMR